MHQVIVGFGDFAFCQFTIDPRGIDVFGRFSGLINKFAIRLDSGDISYLSKKARKMLDEAGLENCKIVASNSLDEYLIRDLMMQAPSFLHTASVKNMGTSSAFLSATRLCSLPSNAAFQVDKQTLSEITLTNSSLSVISGSSNSRRRTSRLPTSERIFR